MSADRTPVTAELLRRLAEAQGRFVVIGGLALGAHAESCARPRTSTSSSTSIPTI
jgi:hypothetical protein